jgi:hypothetical protein
MELERQNRILTLCLTFALLVSLAQGCAALKRAEPAARTMLEHGDEICITLPDDEHQELCGDAVELARLLVAIADKHAELAAARRSSLDDEHPVTIASEVGTSGAPSQ